MAVHNIDRDRPEAFDLSMLKDDKGVLLPTFAEQVIRADEHAQRIAEQAQRITELEAALRRQREGAENV